MILFKLLLAVLPAFAFAAGAPDIGGSQESARFSRLQVDIWPEYDRQAALVILKGELAPSVPVPAAVRVRIPATSGGPSAVAFGDRAGGDLFNLAYERSDSEGHIVLNFTAPQRYIHLEFYDRLGTDTPQRSYTYVWPGDLAVDRLNVRLQEPAASSDISVNPEMGTGVQGPDGLLYRTTEFGPLPAGKSVPVEVRYTKRNARTSRDILGMSAPDPAPQAPAAAAAPEPPPSWTVGLASALLVSLMTVAGVLWWSRRQRSAGGTGAAAAFCRQCGNGLASGDRYCSKCGTAARKR